jgi:hypothetical protein
MYTCIRPTGQPCILCSISHRKKPKLKKTKGNPTQCTNRDQNVGLECILASALQANHVYSVAFIPGKIQNLKMQKGNPTPMYESQLNVHPECIPEPALQANHVYSVAFIPEKTKI